MSLRENSSSPGRATPVWRWHRRQLDKQVTWQKVCWREDPRLVDQRQSHWYIGNFTNGVLERRSSLPWYSNTCLAVTSKTAVQTVSPMSVGRGVRKMGCSGSCVSPMTSRACCRLRGVGSSLARAALLVELSRPSDSFTWKQHRKETHWSSLYLERSCKCCVLPYFVIVPQRWFYVWHTNIPFVE